MPKISVIIASKNRGRFLRQTLDSILQQSFADYEIVVADSTSTDDTLDILQDYKRNGHNIRWKSEMDRHTDEGFYNAMKMARGEYIMYCCVSDGYLNQDWLRKCVEVMGNDPQVSLVYGLPRCMSEDGKLGKVIFSKFTEQPPPQKELFLPFWLGTYFIFPENTFCVRTSVFKECFPKFKTTGYFLQNHALFSFNYNFNINGYLSHFSPVVASFGRAHHDSNNNQLVNFNKRMKKQYLLAVGQYRRNVLKGNVRHFFRDGESNVIGQVQKSELKGLQKKVFRYQLNSRTCLGKRKKRSPIHQLKRLKLILDYYLGKIQ
jgi:glycosyltransferase involved in cell wall biosynthesis